MMRSSVAAAVACLFAGRAVLAQEATRPPIQSVEIKPNRAIYVNGQSFLPIMAWLQNPSNFEIMKSCGMNTATGYAGRSGGQRDVKGYLDLAQKAGLYGVMPFDESLKGHPALLGYIHGDEPDLPSKTSDTMVPRAMPSRTLERYQAIKASDSSRPVFMTLTGNFHPFFKKWSDEQRNNLYPAYIKATDIVGYDIYPIYGWNKPEWIHLVYEATALLTDLSKPRPVYAWIETSKGSRWTGELERQKEVTGEHIRAEVWMAICGGATVIGYFTHIW
ncbi:hypothetical protein FJY63_04290, partial [Candidatus Sumerlaeota bacterium]|nr:hypothetical protein [Candidatus Sumerlaeota bacterium]